MSTSLALDDSIQSLISAITTGLALKDATAPVTTGTINDASTPVTASFAAGYRYAWVTGYGAAHSGINLTYEVYDGVNWYSAFAVSGASGTPYNAGVTGVITTNASFSHLVALPPGTTGFRARPTAFTSGPLSIRIMVGVEPVPGAFALIPNGTQTVSVTGTPTVTNTPTGGNAYSATSTASTNAVAIKGSAGNLYEISASNPTATAAYLKLYNKTTAPTVGSDVPVITIPVAANSVANLAFGALGKRFTTGIALALTGAIGATDTTSSVAGVQIHGTYA